MIVAASKRSQVWFVTHSERLAAAVAEAAGVRPRLVLKREWATGIDGLRRSGAFSGEDD